jgi:hypothetical protein
MRRAEQVSQRQRLIQRRPFEEDRHGAHRRELPRRLRELRRDPRVVALAAEVQTARQPNRSCAALRRDVFNPQVCQIEGVIEP